MSKHLIRATRGCMVRVARGYVAVPTRGLVLGVARICMTILTRGHVASLVRGHVVEPTGQKTASHR